MYFVPVALILQPRFCLLLTANSCWIGNQHFISIASRFISFHHTRFSSLRVVGEFIIIIFFSSVRHYNNQTRCVYSAKRNCRDPLGFFSFVNDLPPPLEKKKSNGVGGGDVNTLCVRVVEQFRKARFISPPLFYYWYFFILLSPFCVQTLYSVSSEAPTPLLLC